MATESKIDLHAEVTAKIIAKLEQGVVPWRQNWTGRAGAGLPVNATTGKAYSGINVVLLWITGAERGYTDNRWLTYKQAQGAGAQVRPGEKGTRAIYVSAYEKTDKKTGEKIWLKFLKSFVLFNVEQCDGFPALAANEAVETLLPVAARLPHIDAYLKATGIEIRENGQNPCYTRQLDYVALPEFENFHSADAFYVTAFHEVGHATGHESRCNRQFGKRFGDKEYAVEELTAELAAAFQAATFGLSNEDHEQSASYISYWLKVLRNSDQILTAAAAAASKACAWLDAASGRVAPAADEVEQAELACAA